MLSTEPQGCSVDSPNSYMNKRHHNKGLRKLCGCSRRNWPKCAHAWYFNFKPRGGVAYQFSLDVELGEHPKTKEKAQAEADRIRNQIRAGTFVRAAERRKGAEAPATTSDAVTLEMFTKTYLERVSQVRDRNKSWTNDRHMFTRLCAFTVTDGSRLGGRTLGDCRRGGWASSLGSRFHVGFLDLPNRRS